MASEKVELPTVEGGPGGERCDKCYYWELLEKIDDELGEGECRVKRPKIGRSKSECGAGNYGDFPIMLESTWCGEFRPRPQPKG